MGGYYIISSDERKVDTSRLQNEMRNRMGNRENIPAEHPTREFEEGYRKGYEDGYRDHAQEVNGPGHATRYGH